MDMGLEALLQLVGTLDDNGGTDSARERFRRFLRTDVTGFGTLQDYIESCTRNAGPQFARALQDLVNRLGELLGFEVEYGRYAGRQGEIGFDGLWRAGDKRTIVVETKTTAAYTIDTNALLGYLNELVSEGRALPEPEPIGLYVLARPSDSSVQLANAIVGQRRQHKLRIVSVQSLLQLADLRSQYQQVADALNEVLFPGGPTIDPVVELLYSLHAESAGGGPTSDKPIPDPTEHEATQTDTQPACYITPVRWKGRRSPLEEIGKLLKAKKYAFAPNTPCRSRMKAGDRLCFYGSNFGVFADARLDGAPEENPLPDLVNEPNLYCWTVSLSDVHIYESNPIVITPDLRAQLDAFKGSAPSKAWGWFVTPTRELTVHDFALLTQKAK